METKSRSVPTGVPSRHSHHYKYETESSEMEFDQRDDFTFYEKFDEEIYQFVDGVETLLASVSKEREILSMLAFNNL